MSISDVDYYEKEVESFVPRGDHCEYYNDNQALECPFFNDTKNGVFCSNTTLSIGKKLDENENVDVIYRRTLRPQECIDRYGKDDK